MVTKMSNIVVTGANGFIGSFLVGQLAFGGYIVRGCSRHRTDFGVQASVRWAQSPELGAHSDWSGVVEGADIILNTAARVHVWIGASRESRAGFLSGNLDGTMGLAEQAAQANGKA